MSEADEIHSRLSKVRTKMLSADIDILIVSTTANIYYLSNYTATRPCVEVLLVSRDSGEIITREYTGVTSSCDPPHVQSNSQHVDIEGTNTAEEDENKALLDDTKDDQTNNTKESRDNIFQSSFYDPTEDPISFISQQISKYNPKNIGLEYNTLKLSYGQVTKLISELRSHNPGVEFSDCSQLIGTLCLIKSSAEISHMRKAADQAYESFSSGLYCTEPLKRETTIANYFASLLCHGLDKDPVTMDTGLYESSTCRVSVASGVNGCRERCHIPTDKEVRRNEIVYLEVTGCYKHYHAARVHTVFVADEYSDDWESPEWFTEVETIVKQALAAGREALKPGARACEVDTIMRDIFSKYEKPYIQPTLSGYSIGLGFDKEDWTNNTLFYISPTSPHVVQENMTIHLLPWLQLPGLGAVGYSDTVLVTETGGVSLFAGKELNTFRKCPAYSITSYATGFGPNAKKKWWDCFCS